MADAPNELWLMSAACTTYWSNGWPLLLGGFVSGTCFGVIILALLIRRSRRQP